MAEVTRFDIELRLRTLREFIAQMRRVKEMRVANDGYAEEEIGLAWSEMIGMLTILPKIPRS